MYVYLHVRTILGESLVREADRGGGNIIQGLLSSDLHFLWGYVDVADRRNKKLYFTTSF